MSGGLGSSSIPQPQFPHVKRGKQGCGCERPCRTRGCRTGCNLTGLPRGAGWAVLCRAGNPSLGVVGTGDKVHTFSTTCPPLAEGGSGLEWLKVTTSASEGLCWAPALTPCEASVVRSRLLGWLQWPGWGGTGERLEHTGVVYMEPPRWGQGRVGTSLPGRQVTFPGRGHREAPQRASSLRADEGHRSPS